MVTGLLLQPIQRGLAPSPYKAAARRQGQRQPRRQPRTAVEPRAAWQDLAGVLALSAAPFLAVQALADSSLGKQLQERLERCKAEFKREEAQREQQLEQARAESPWYGEQRPLWLPWARPPAHLTGELPGDYGYDPLGLAAAGPQAREQYLELELLHARWAMLGALGALVPEVLQRTGIAYFAEPRWWNVGYAKLQGEDLNYLGIAGLRIAGGQGVAVIAVCQVLLMFGPEYARSCGIEALEPLGIYLPGDKIYPGGVFDPLRLSEGPAQFEDLKVKEIKNGRLAMVAWLGFAAQAAVTREGAVDNLVAFVQDPGRNNLLTTLGMK